MAGIEQPGTETKYSIQAWQNDDGLPHDTVVSMVQTRDGYLWVGTLGGLVRFDGLHFSSVPELNGSRIVHLFEDSERILWIGTETSGTLMLRDRRLIAPTELAAGGIGRRLRAACEDSLGAVWLYYENGDLWRYSRDRFAPFVLPHEESSTRTMIQETNGTLWIGTLRHQYSVGTVVENGSLELPIAQDISFPGRLEALVASRHGGYWRLSSGQIQRVIGGTPRTITPYRWPVEVASACEDSGGRLIVGTKGAGVFVIRPDGAVSSLTTTQGLSANFVLSVLVDHEGTLWAGTDGGGVNRVKRQSFATLESSRNWWVQSVTEDPDRNLWIGSYGKGLGRWANGAMQQFGGGGYLQGGWEQPVFVQTVFADREKRVWVSTTRKELLQFRSGAFYGANDGGLVRHNVQAIHQDRAGRMWFGTEGGLISFANGEWKLFTAEDGLSSTNITALADDADGNIWIGTQHGGVNRWREGKFRTLLKGGGAFDEISALIVDKHGVVWTATPAGLGRWKKEKWTTYTTREGLATDRLSYLIEDEEENLWIGSNAGVLRVPKKALNDFANGRAVSISCRAYGKEDGLPTRGCAFGSQPAAWRGHDGRLWFSTLKGVAALDLAQFTVNTNPPPVVIESVLIDDVALAQSSHESFATNVVLKPGDERLDIHYTSLNLSAPHHARFRYRLQGYEKDWTEAGEQPDSNARVARYRKLSPGHYTFRIHAANEDGVWNESGTSLPIVVLPPIWRTWWFTAITALTFFAITAGIVHYLSTQRLQRQLAVMQQQEALEKERARIARDIHDQVGASLTQVALLGELVETDKDSPDEVQSHAQQISQTARETTRALDEIVWTVNPQNDTLEGLVNYICKYAQDYLAVAGLRYRFDLPSQLPACSITPEVRHNVFLASKEAITNIVRHANATAVWVRLRVDLSSVVLEIEDDGRGVGNLETKAAQSRNGLKNMRKRMEEIGGQISIGPGRERGTLVRLTLALNNAHPPGTPA